VGQEPLPLPPPPGVPGAGGEGEQRRRRSSQSDVACRRIGDIRQLRYAANRRGSSMTDTLLLPALATWTRLVLGFIATPQGLLPTAAAPITLPVAPSTTNRVLLTGSQRRRCRLAGASPYARRNGMPAEAKAASSLSIAAPRNFSSLACKSCSSWSVRTAESSSARRLATG